MSNYLELSCAAHRAVNAMNGRVLGGKGKPLNREVAIGILCSLGLQIETGHNGKHVLDIKQDEHIDVAFMDCEMLIMDGFSATTARRHRERRASVCLSLT